MRIAALYDIHGNLPALEAVIGEIRTARLDAVVVGGDVLPGPMPHESLAALRALGLPMRCIRGNGDRVVLDARHGRQSSEVPVAFREVVQWNASQLSPEDVSTLERWPATLSIDHPTHGRILFCHATPRSDVENFTRRSDEERIAPAFAGIDAALVICGHTHMPFDRTVRGIRLVNAGSVGMPFGRPGASWLIIGETVEFRHTEYDLDAAAARIRLTNYPQRDVFAAHNVLAPPSEEQMLDVLDGGSDRS